MKDEGEIRLGMEEKGRDCKVEGGRGAVASLRAQDILPTSW